MRRAIFVAAVQRRKEPRFLLGTRGWFILGFVAMVAAWLSPWLLSR
jgi:hypothetical protein